MKVALVTRHKLLPSQEEAIKKAGLEVVETIQQIPEKPEELQKFVQELKQKGVEAILTVALPPHLLAQLQRFFKILIFKMEAIATVPQEQAEKLVAEAPHKRVALPGRPGEPFRVMEFKGIFEVKVVIEEKPIITV